MTIDGFETINEHARNRDGTLLQKGYPRLARSFERYGNFFATIRSRLANLDCGFMALAPVVKSQSAIAIDVNSESSMSGEIFGTSCA